MKYGRVIKIVKEAGRLLENKENNIDKKGEFDYVTNKDIEVQEFLIKQLRKIDKTFKFIAEESQKNNKCMKNTWVIDPIDGTTNFIHGYPHFAISLAHIINSDIYFGIIYNPKTNEMFIGEKGKGSYLNGKRLKVSKRNKLSESIIGFGLPYDKEKGKYMFEKASKIYIKAQDVKRKGAASLDIAYVASGRLEAYFEIGLKMWDVMAGKLILEEAEGSLEKIEVGSEGIYTFAHNNKINEEIIKEIFNK
ncbi:MAG: inositol monophosphatase family protein [Clostridium sp.]